MGSNTQAQCNNLLCSTLKKRVEGASETSKTKQKNKKREEVRKKRVRGREEEREQNTPQQTFL
jgi:hypothetical protein